MKWTKSGKNDQNIGVTKDFVGMQLFLKLCYQLKTEKENNNKPKLKTFEKSRTERLCEKGKRRKNTEKPSYNQGKMAPKEQRSLYLRMCGNVIKNHRTGLLTKMHVIFESLARISLKPFDAQELSIALFFLSPIYNPQKCFNGSHNVYAKVRKAPPTKLELSHSIGGMLFPAISRPFHQHAWHYVSISLRQNRGSWRSFYPRFSEAVNSRFLWKLVVEDLYLGVQQHTGLEREKNHFAHCYRRAFHHSTQSCHLQQPLWFRTTSSFGSSHTHTTPVVVGGYL